MRVACRTVSLVSLICPLWLAWLLLAALGPARAAAATTSLRAATGTIDQALAQTRRAPADCQTVLSGNLQAARGMVDNLKIQWTPEGARQAKDWLATTAAAGALGGCHEGVLALVRRASSQVAESGEEALAPAIEA